VEGREIRVLNLEVSLTQNPVNRQGPRAGQWFTGKKIISFFKGKKYMFSSGLSGRKKG